MNEELLNELEELLKEGNSTSDMWVLGILLLCLFDFPTRQEPTINIYLGSDE